MNEKEIDGEGFGVEGFTMSRDAVIDEKSCILHSSRLTNKAWDQYRT